MPRMKLEVVLETPEGGEETQVVQIDGRDIRAYEAEFEESFLTETSLTQFTKIAWMTLRRRDRYSGTYQEFERQCVDVDRADDGAAESSGPTRSDLGDGS